jgi:methyltransferase (TIGR00027 family)
MYVALARAIATHSAQLSHVCADPWAERLLPFPLAKLVAWAVEEPSLGLVLAGVRTILFGMAEHMALRTHLIDQAVTESMAMGAEQLVLVGAGLDARAHRLASLAACDVYEVDFASTQAFKQQRAQALPVLARSLHYAACDFERTGLEQALHTCGFRPERKSVWIWEGVTMYLTEAMVAASLKTFARLSAPDSRVIATYLGPVPDEHKALSALALSMLAAVSEPIRSHFTQEALTSLLHEHGFSSTRDVSPRDVAARYAVRFPAFAFGAPRERIVVADKRVPA